MSTIDRDPMLYKLASRVEEIKDIMDDLMEAMEMHNKNFKDITTALGACHKWLTIHEKRMNKLEKNGKTKKLR